MTTAKIRECLAKYEKQAHILPPVGKALVRAATAK